METEVIKVGDRVEIKRMHVLATVVQIHQNGIEVKVDGWKNNYTFSPWELIRVGTVRPAHKQEVSQETQENQSTEKDTEKAND